VAIGLQAGQGSVLIGNQAGTNNHAQWAVAIGQNAGYIYQGFESVAIGIQAVYGTQGKSASAIAIAIGNQAGLTAQGHNSIAIDSYVGFNSQGQNSIALGNMTITYLLGGYMQPANTTLISKCSVRGISNEFSNCVAESVQAGQFTQESGNIAIGNQAGQSNQSQT
jgi:hypothetical protein